MVDMEELIWNAVCDTVCEPIINAVYDAVCESFWNTVCEIIGNAVWDDVCEPITYFSNIENLFKGTCNNYIDKVVDGWLVKCLHK